MVYLTLEKVRAIEPTIAKGNALIDEGLELEVRNPLQAIENYYKAIQCYEELKNSLGENNIRLLKMQSDLYGKMVIASSWYAYNNGKSLIDTKVLKYKAEIDKKIERLKQKWEKDL